MGEKRANFAGKLSAVLVAAGSAVGLGNIWRFPSLAADNGGGAFLVIYLLCVLLLGFPLLLAEFSVGRSTQLGAVGAYAKLNRRWGFIGYFGVLAAFLLLGFYYVVSGWTLEYFISSVTGRLAQYSTPEEYRELFDSFKVMVWRPLLMAWTFILITHFVIAQGVQKGIERMSNILMPLLFVILFVLAIHSVFMPGAGDGLRFFLNPDFQAITPKTVLMAMGQAFFSLSIGMGCMVTYASYFNRTTNLKRTALQVTLLDTLVAITAGFIIFPAAFSVGIFNTGEVPMAGPGLIFITLPAIFNSLPWSMLWSAIFFLLIIVAALTSTISIHEVVAAYLHEEWKLERKRANWLSTFGMFVVATLGSLSLGILNECRIFGLNFFDLFDYVTANLLLPLGGLCTSIFVGWILDKKFLEKELSTEGKRSAIVPIVHFMLRWVCPLIVLIIFLDSLGLFK
uniref:sodium-dependent transporter n=1 Tax=Alistipes sp. TaxID=1872444 RepID=UPI00405609E5